MSYNDLSRALHKANSTFHPSEIHGLLCGLICATPGKANPAWEQQLDIPLDEALQAALQEIYAPTEKEISEFSLEFSLLLPPDKTSLSSRTEALSMWCEGFLTGLKKGLFNVSLREPGDVADALNDLVEIAQVNYDDIEDNEENEAAFFELIDYVRLIVLMIYHEKPELLH